MVPGQPGQAVPVRIQSRAAVEVIPRDQDFPGFKIGSIWIDVETDDGVNRFSTGNGMVFPHADQALALAIEDKVGVAEICLGG